MNKHLSIVQLAVLAVVLPVLSAPTTLVQAAEAVPAVQKAFNTLIGAVEANDRDAFVANATTAVRQGMTHQVMQGLYQVLGTRLANGYKAAYLCRLKQAGHQVHLWKVRFKDGGDDVVIRIALKNGKVGGFFRQ